MPPLQGMPCSIKQNKTKQKTYGMRENICKRCNWQYPKYINSSYNLISKNRTTQSKNGQKTYIDIFPKKMYLYQQAHEKMLKLIIREMQIKTISYHQLE